MLFWEVIHVGQILPDSAFQISRSMDFRQVFILLAGVPVYPFEKGLELYYRFL